MARLKEGIQKRLREALIKQKNEVSRCSSNSSEKKNSGVILYPRLKPSKTELISATESQSNYIRLKKRVPHYMELEHSPAKISNKIRNPSRKFC